MSEVRDHVCVCVCVSADGWRDESYLLSVCLSLSVCLWCFHYLSVGVSGFYNGRVGVRVGGMIALICGVARREGGRFPLMPMTLSE